MTVHRKKNKGVMMTVGVVRAVAQLPTDSGVSLKAEPAGSADELDEGKMEVVRSCDFLRWESTGV